MPALACKQYGDLNIEIHDTRKSLGRAAAELFASRVAGVLATKDDVNVVFASAPSQNDFLAALLERNDIPWNRINAFHLDEYVGLDPAAPQGFGNFIRDALWGRVPLRSANYLNGNAPDIAAECDRYGRLLAAYPTDVIVFGIGENGHLAFNDPPVADFHDRTKVKEVVLDRTCRQQQVNDGCFAAFDEVPERALTMTIPAIAAARTMVGLVPGPTKARALSRTAFDPIGEACPSTVLRLHPSVFLFADLQSAAELP